VNTYHSNSGFTPHRPAFQWSYDYSDHWGACGAKDKGSALRTTDDSWTSQVVVINLHTFLKVSRCTTFLLLSSSLTSAKVWSGQSSPAAASVRPKYFSSWAPYTRIVKPLSGVREMLHCWATFSLCPSGNEPWKYIWADNIWGTSNQRRAFQRYNNFDTFTFALMVMCSCCHLRNFGGSEGGGGERTVQYFST
jgi:hypothetical protein